MTGDNVIILPVETILDLPLERVLDGAVKNEVYDTIILGYTREGFYFASQSCDAGKMLVLLERARRYIMNRLEG